MIVGFAEDDKSTLLLTDIASLYGMNAPSFRKECEMRGVNLKGHKQKYSPKEIDTIIQALGVPKTVKQLLVR